MIPLAGDDLAELRAHPFGRVLTEPQLERLFRCASVLDVPAGGFVFREGEPANGFFLIESTELYALDGACVREEMQVDPALGLAIAMQLNHQLYLRLERVRMQRLDLYRTGS